MIPCVLPDEGLPWREVRAMKASRVTSVFLVLALITVCAAALAPPAAAAHGGCACHEPDSPGACLANAAVPEVTAALLPDVQPLAAPPCVMHPGRPLPAPPTPDSLVRPLPARSPPIA